MFKKLLSIMIAGGFMAACSMTKAPQKVEASMPVASEPVVVTPEPVVASAPVVMNHNSVYFGFNKYDINSDYLPLIKTNGNYLASDKSAMVKVEGNTDAIGSIEYNLALGQRRARAVKLALVAGGASPKQIEAVSNGKVKSKYPNDTDEMRAKNRRADIMYKSGQPQGYSMDDKGLPQVDGSFYQGSVNEGVM